MTPHAVSKVKLTFLSTSDFHSAHTGRVDAEFGGKLLGGTLRIANFFHQHLSKDDDFTQTIILDAGDQFLGSPFFTFFNGEVEVKALKLMRYTALGIGNHDFDQGGIPNLKRQMAHANGQVEFLCGNLFDDATGNLAFKSSFIKEISFKTNSTEYKLKVGIIGVMGLDAWEAVPPGSRRGFSYKDCITAAREISAEMKPHVDIMVCLGHTGVDKGHAEDLCNLGAFDIVLTGHQHFSEMKEWRVIEASQRNVYFHPGNAHGRAVQKISLSLTIENNNDNTKILSRQVELQNVVMDERFDLKPEVERNGHLNGHLLHDSYLYDIKKMLEDYDSKIKKVTEEVVTKVPSTSFSRHHLDKHFTPYNLTPLTSLVLDAHFHIYDEFKNQIAQTLYSIEESHSVFFKSVTENNIVAMVNFGAIRGGLEEGDCTVGHLINVFPFNPSLEIIKLKGKYMSALQRLNEERCHGYQGNCTPGMAYHFKWFDHHLRDEHDLKIKDHQFERDFYLLTTSYIRENDIIKVVNDNSDMQVMSLKVNHIPGIRDGLVHLVKHKKRKLDEL